MKCIRNGEKEFWGRDIFLWEKIENRLKMVNVDGKDIL
jgi:hypothetical protein